MSSRAAQGIVFLVRGQRDGGNSRSARGQFVPPDSDGRSERQSWEGLQGEVKAVIRLAGTGRDGEQTTTQVTAVPGDDVVVLTLEDGPTLVLHPEHARDLLRSQALAVSQLPTEAGGQRSADGTGQRPADTAGQRSAATIGAIEVPTTLEWPTARGQADPGASRGRIGRVIVKTLAVIAPNWIQTAAQATAGQIAERVDGRVKEGVYPIGKEMPESLWRPGDGAGAPLADKKLGNPDKPVLVLIHGTFVDTPSTFGKLWRQHPAVVERLFGRYGANGVFALDHATMGRSPIANALSLLQACAPGARLDLLTHSRGGLVAEVLARVCAAPGAPAAAPALDANETNLFKNAPGQARDLAECYRLAHEKGVVIEKIVRVACPARGTLLASERLDAAISVFRWALEQARVPVLPELIGFLGEVARRRMAPDELPGLQAMLPDSALVEWIHACPGPIPGELRVVAGDLEGDSLGSWVKTLVADSFFWTDNDLVVQTRSMYGGGSRGVGAAARQRPATYFLARGGRISHFSYFSESTTVAAIESALLDEQPDRFAVIGPLSAWGRDSSGSRAARDGSAPEKPALFVLPGILGSHISRDEERIWLAPQFFNGLTKLEWDDTQEAEGGPCRADGPLRIYDDLIRFLGRNHEVIPFDFDWRQPIDREARRLAKQLEAEMTAREQTGTPVRLLAHSMGGLVARAVEIVAPDTWRKLMTRAGTRLVMLGTPNGGSWAPMQLLTGDDDFGNTIAAVGALFADGRARRIFAGLPGLFSMQAGYDDPALGLTRTEEWQRLADRDQAALRQSSVWHDGMPRQPLYQWSGPPQAILNRAVSFRQQLNALLPLLPADRFAIVLGSAALTPAGFDVDVEGLFYEMERKAGDGRVLDRSAMLPGVATWRADAGHADLVSAQRHFEAYEELLVDGFTARLPRVTEDPRPAGRRSRSGASDRDTGDPRSDDTQPIRVRPSRQRSALPPPGERLQGIDSSTVADDSTEADDDDRLKISVIHGDLRFTEVPLMIGHYDSLQLLGTEATIDGLLGGSLSKALRARLYPDQPGTHRVFVNIRSDPDNPWNRPRPPWVVVAGLGAEGLIQPAHLTASVRQAVVSLAHRLVEARVGDNSSLPPSFELCTTLMGSGVTGITAVQSGQLIAQGVVEANALLRQEQVDWPWVRHLQIVELYLDRAAETWRTLSLLGAAQSRRYRVEPWLQNGIGGLRRPADTGGRAARFDTISAISNPNNPGAIDYTIDSRRARTELRAQMTQGKLVEQLVSNAWERPDPATRLPLIGRSLFKLLVPFEVEPWFGGEGAVVLEVDSTTAAIPWELLDADDDSSGRTTEPWAVRTQLVRRLRTAEFRAITIDSSTDDRALVIGDPDCDRSRYPLLPDAREEAREVVKVLEGCKDSGRSSVTVTKRIADEHHRVGPHEIINVLLEDNYRIIHIAAHGEPNLPADPVKGTPAQARGVVLSGGVYIGANEVKAMRKVPELVFLNCCYLGRFSAEQPAQANPQSQSALPNRPAFAAGVADELIRAGVRCVIAAGWPVDDRAARAFATRFYEKLLGGSPFIEAVHAARRAAWDADKKGTTWAAYQCYGDPGWRWRGGNGYDDSVDRYSTIASAIGLVMELEQLTTTIRYGGDSPERIARRLRRLRDLYETRWGREGQVAEAFGAAYGALGDLKEAMMWYSRSTKAADGTGTLKATLAICSLLVDKGLPASEREAFMTQLNDQIRQIEQLYSITLTADRAELLGRANLQLARLLACAVQGPSAGIPSAKASSKTEASPDKAGQGAVGQETTTRDSFAKQEGEALEHAQKRFAEAAKRHLEEGNPALQLWPALSQLMVTTRLQLQDSTSQDRAESAADVSALLTQVEGLLAEQNARRPDFRSKVAEPLLRLVQAARAPEPVEGCFVGLLEAFRQIHEKAPAQKRWLAVLDDAAFILEPWIRFRSRTEKQRQEARDVLDRLRGYAGISRFDQPSAGESETRRQDGSNGLAGTESLLEAAAARPPKRPATRNAAALDPNSVARTGSKTRSKAAGLDSRRGRRPGPRPVSAPKSRR